jgi:hypothetical protein
VDVVYSGLSGGCQGGVFDELGFYVLYSPPLTFKLMSEIVRHDLPPQLATLSDEDLEGVIKRAKRENVPLEQLQVRVRDLVEEEVDTEEQFDRDVQGIRERMDRENKEFDQIALRKNDDPMVLKRALRKAQAAKSTNFVGKSDGKGRPTGTLSDDYVRSVLADADKNRSK